MFSFFASYGAVGGVAPCRTGGVLGNALLSRGPIRDPLHAAKILQQLESQPGEQLVFMRYSPKHILQDEWVFNGPNIPRQRVIWARAMTSSEDMELQRYFPNRTVWLLEPDADPLKLARLN